MKNTCTFIAALCIYLLSITRSAAQPVIADGANTPAAGNSYPVMNGPATVAPGAGGTAVTWDLSALSLSNVGTYMFENPATTPVAGTYYPAGNSALSVTPTGSAALYSYYIITPADESELANSVTTTVGSGRNYTPKPRKIMKFPFNYADTFTSTYATATTSGYDFFEYDGYGTLKLPWATYTNVVRVKCTYASSVGYAYNWYTLSPLLNVLSYSSIPNTYTGLSFVPTEIPAANLANNAVTVAPNPFANSTVIAIDAATELRDAFVIIVDAAGRTIRKMPVTSHSMVVNSDGMCKGIYQYAVFSNNTRIANGKLNIQ